VLSVEKAHKMSYYSDLGVMSKWVQIYHDAVKDALEAVGRFPDCQVAKDGLEGARKTLSEAVAAYEEEVRQRAAK
jgi:hypothetical protein